MNSITLFWFRRDLRLQDNTALNKAIQHCRQTQSKLFPIFIFDKNILSELPSNDARVSFIHETLKTLHEKFQEKGSNLHTYFDTPLKVFNELSSKYAIDALFCNEDYEPYALQREERIKEFCNLRQITFKTYKDHVIFHKDDIVKSDGAPYVVYTPYKNVWLSKFYQLKLESLTESLENVCLPERPTDMVSLESMGFNTSDLKIPDSKFETPTISNYAQTRDFPSQLKGTSLLGIHLRFGTISIRELILDILSIKNHETFLSELIWREFFIQILWHFPHTVKSSFKPQYDRIEWKNNEILFEHWKNGTTGYPIVDAGMRQLKQTGYMHNRVRMIVASFLCKHLLIDWRWGEAHFAKHLLDYELASNVGNWQWASGSGVDAAPYFRIFNPHTQLKKFDPHLEYVKQWVPEYNTTSYSKPIVDHSFARERCLDTYKMALNS